MSSDGPKRRTPGRGLGRGLGALIANTQSANEAANESAEESTGHTPGRTPGRTAYQTADHAAAAEQQNLGAPRQLPIESITPNPQQPRSHFDAAALHELAASIREHGIIQPLVVTPSPQDPARYWLVAGERRWRAAQLADLDQVPVTIRDASTQQRLEWALVENIQRADLNALEEAAAYAALMEEFGLTQAEVGRRVGKSRSAVANTLRLLQLPQPVQDALLAATISPGHARALLALEDETLILNTLERILSRNLSVRQTEELIRQLLTQPPEATPLAEEEVSGAKEQLAFLENRLRDALGTRVNLNRNRDGSGRLVVHFYNDDDLAGIYQLIAGDDEDLD
ncbi:MAG: ParB/RepB/Spo0J family partition protein [Litorilinea sp.]